MAPIRKGFGSVVLERMILQIAEASASLKFQPTGVVWYAEAPLASFVDGDGVIFSPDQPPASNSTGCH